jgi:hypothetical protein
MKPIAIVGLLIALAGAWVTINGGSFTTREEIVDIGDVEISADREREIPMWAGIGAIVVGLAMVGAGMSKKGAAR